MKGRIEDTEASKGAPMNEQRTVAIACASADGLAGDVSGHFGHTPYFVVASHGDQLPRGSAAP
jgi:hypothetical protein